MCSDHAVDGFVQAVAEQEIMEAEAKLDVLLAGSRPEDIEAMAAELARLEAERDYVARQLELLVIHSPIDASVNFEHASYISEAIENSELLIVENESHFSTLNPEAAAKVRTFLQKVE